MVYQPIIFSSVASSLEKFQYFKIFKNCSIFRSVLLKIDQRPQTNFDLKMLIISCHQTEDITNIIKLPTFFVIGLERCSK